jgi:putative SOS response-associated peptidase YedK
VTDANPFMANIHDRMAVFLIQEGIGPWLREEFGPQTRLPVPVGLSRARPLCRRLNSSAAAKENATLTEAFEPLMQ